MQEINSNSQVFSSAGASNSAPPEKSQPKSHDTSSGPCDIVAESPQGVIVQDSSCNEQASGQTVQDADCTVTSGDNTPSQSQDYDKFGDVSQKNTLSSLLERDFKDFEAIYPNVSKNELIRDDNLRLFAQGKENTSLRIIYAEYQKMVISISQNALKQEEIKRANAKSSVGALLGANDTPVPFFTKEQVLKMSSDQIKANFEKIRKSQERW